MYGYFANKSKHRLIVKNIHKNMAIYLKNRKSFGPHAINLRDFTIFKILISYCLLMF